MKAILDLLHDNESLTEQLRAVESIEGAAELLAAASKQRGQSVDVIEITEWLAKRPKPDTDDLSDDELQAVSGGALPRVTTTLCTVACCVTCRSTAIIY